MRKGRQIKPKPRAFIVRFVSTNDLIELILKKKLPNQRTPEVKSNRDYRIFACSSEAAWKEMMRMGIHGDQIESIFQLNS